jgi:hypothetical protein
MTAAVRFASLLILPLVLVSCHGSRSSQPVKAEAATGGPGALSDMKPSNHTAAGGSESNVESRPNRFGPMKKPPGVPDEYVFTRHGFMHPSCVINVRPDGTMANGNGTVLVSVGGERGTIPGCPYVRYGLDGHLITSNGRESSAMPVGNRTERDASVSR